MWINYMHTYIPSLLSLSPHKPLPSQPLGPRTALTELPAIQQLSASYLFNTWWYICVSATRSIHPTFSIPTVSTRLLSMSVSLFLPCKRIHLYCFSRFPVYGHTNTWYLIFSFDFTLYDTLCSSTSLQMTVSFLSYTLIVFYCIYVPHLLYPFLSWGTFRLLPCQNQDYTWIWEV